MTLLSKHDPGGLTVEHHNDRCGTSAPAHTWQFPVTITSDFSTRSLDSNDRSGVESLAGRERPSSLKWDMAPHPSPLSRRIGLYPNAHVIASQPWSGYALQGH